jgi:hypothetical protein
MLFWNSTILNHGRSFNFSIPKVILDHNYVAKFGWAFLSLKWSSAWIKMNLNFREFALKKRQGLADVMNCFSFFSFFPYSVVQWQPHRLTRLSRDLLSFAFKKKITPLFFLARSCFLLASFSFAVIYIRFGDSFLPPGRLEEKRERMPAPAHSCISFSLRGWFYKCEISLPVCLASLWMHDCRSVAIHPRKRATWLGKFIGPNKYDLRYAQSIANKFSLAGRWIFYFFVFFFFLYFCYFFFFTNKEAILVDRSWQHLVSFVVKEIRFI